MSILDFTSPIDPFAAAQGVELYGRRDATTKVPLRKAFWAPQFLYKRGGSATGCSSQAVVSRFVAKDSERCIADNRIGMAGGQQRLRVGFCSEVC